MTDAFLKIDLGDMKEAANAINRLNGSLSSIKDIVQQLQEIEVAYRKNMELANNLYRDLSGNLETISTNLLESRALITKTETVLRAIKEIDKLKSTK